MLNSNLQKFLDIKKDQKEYNITISDFVGSLLEEWQNGIKLSELPRYINNTILSSSSFLDTSSILDEQSLELYNGCVEILEEKCRSLKNKIFDFKEDSESEEYAAQAQNLHEFVTYFAEAVDNINNQILNFYGKCSSSIMYTLISIDICESMNNSTDFDLPGEVPIDDSIL